MKIAILHYVAKFLGSLIYIDGLPFGSKPKFNEPNDCK